MRTPPPLAFLASQAPALPVRDVLPALCAGLEKQPNAVLCAPPGAGKTTLVPLALLTSPWLKPHQRILMLEPRRLAARAAARRMAALLHEDCGQRVGYRMRLDSQVSAATRMEVVTEGILTRLLQDDPTLERVGCVIFDEFHERSLQADTGLALCLDVQQALRPDLRLLVMSATLDSQAVAALLGHCPVHISQGQSFAVDIRYLPPPPHSRCEEHVAAVTRHMLREEEGSILVFLPGTAEIRRVESLLGPQPAPDVTVYPLYGDLPPALQDAALLPCAPPQRKVVLSTAIAETSLTIEGVRVVVDAGLARSAVYDPATGMGRLVTGKVSLAAAQQRAGRAGRLEKGVACRLWAEGENHSLRPFARPEILEADLAPLLLQLALWGVNDPAALCWLDAPPQAAVEEARQTLRQLEALDAQGRITPHGKALAALPLHPRLAHMLLCAPRIGSQDADSQNADTQDVGAQDTRALALCLAAFLSERAPTRSLDVRQGLDELCRGQNPAPHYQRLRRHAVQLARCLSAQGRPPQEKTLWAQARAEVEDCGALLALAWPHWVGQNMGPGQYRLRNGSMATLPEDSPLAREPFLAVAALDGKPPRARIFAAAPLAEEQVHRLFAAHMRQRDSVHWDTRSEAVLARRQCLLDALVLHDAPLTDAASDALTEAVVQGIAALGLHCLPWTDELRQWQARVHCLRQWEGEVWPAVDDASLLQHLPLWLGPFLPGITRRAQFRQIDLAAALHALLPWDLQKKLERQAPTHVEVPSGSRVRIDYTAPGGPVLAVKLQEMFGCAATPCIAGGRIPLTLHLNSPAGRPLQVTRDLAGFWASGYAAVRAEMRGRYPKHPWPDNPATAQATRHTKNRAARLATQGEN